jgi:hypothetical protein
MSSLLLILLAAPSQLSAYTDPGSGILIWQIAIATFAGLAFKFRTLWFKLFKK